MLNLYACSSGPTRGRVIDAGTREPIPGAVVVGEWSTISLAFSGGNSECYDARETVTDTKGDFEIPGIAYGPFSGSDVFDLSIFNE